MDWTLDCCNDKQFFSIFLIICYAILIFKLWKLAILHPFKILTVFLHELSHATAAWLTGGKVKSMDVQPNEGGVTRTVGGIQWIILSAGYIGSGVWGMALLIASGYQLASEIAAFVLIFFLVIFIFYAKNNYFRLLNIGFILLLGGLLALDFATDADPCQYATLFIGVMSCLFSVYDIWDDLISRRVNQSDASVFAKMTHTSSRCWGVIWGIFALCTLVAAVYFNLLVAQDEGPKISSLREASLRTQIVMGITALVLLLAILHSIFARRWMVEKMRPRSRFVSFV